VNEGENEDQKRSLGPQSSPKIDATVHGSRRDRQTVWRDQLTRRCGSLAADNRHL